jgi:hypothetical protein
MIKLRDLTPNVYYNESRDFQLLGRLFDTVLNEAKTNVDLLYNLPFSEDSSEETLELWALTLGLQNTQNYDATQLRAICGVFPQMLKAKGSLRAIELACKALFYAEGSTSAFSVEQVKKNNVITGIKIFVPSELKGITILQSVLNYIIPAGLSCSILRNEVLKSESLTAVNMQSKVKYYLEQNLNKYSKIAHVVGDQGEKNSVIQEALENTIINLNTPENGIGVLSQSGFIGTGTVYRAPVEEITPVITNDTEEEEDKV